MAASGLARADCLAKGRTNKEIADQLEIRAYREGALGATDGPSSHQQSHRYGPGGAAARVDRALKIWNLGLLISLHSYLFRLGVLLLMMVVLFDQYDPVGGAGGCSLLP